MAYQETKSNGILALSESLKSSNLQIPIDDTSPIDIPDEISQKLNIYHIELEVQNEELRQSQEALAESHKRYYKHFEFAPIGIIRTDLDGIILDANQMALEFLGIAKDSLRRHPKKLIDFLEVRDRTKYEEHLVELRKDVSYHAIDARMHSRQGCNKYVRIQSTVSGCETRGVEAYTTIIDISEITSTRNHLAKLNAETEKLAMVASKTRNIAFITDRSGQIEWFNESASMHFGLYYNSEENVNFLKIISDRSQELDVLENIKEAIIKRENFSVEAELLINHNKKAWFQIDSDTVINEKSIITNYVILCTDITELKESERDSIEAKERFKKLFSHSITGKAVLSSSGKIVEANNAFIKIVSRNGQKVKGSNIKNFVDISSSKLLEMLTQASYRSSKKLKDMVWELKDNCYPVKQTATSLSPLRYNLRGRQVLIEMQDVTREHKLKSALIHREQQLKCMMEQAPLGIVRMDLDARLISWNDYFLNILELSKTTNIIDHLLDDVLRNPDVSCVPYIDKIRQNSSSLVQFETTVNSITEYGSKIHIHFHLSAILGDKGKPLFIMGVCEDVSHQKELENHKLQSAKVEALGLFAGGIAHDFNNMMMGLLSNLDFCLMDKPDRELLEEAREAALRASKLAARLVSFSKGGIFEIKSHSVASLITPAVEFALRGSNIKPVFDIPLGIPNILADAEQLTLVIDNLAINSRDVMPDGGHYYVSTKFLQITEDSSKLGLKCGNYIKLNFIDEGGGVPDDIRSKIFDPYFTTKPQGNGIGLATCNNVVSKHNGTITISNTSNGACFTVIIPAAESVDNYNLETEFKECITGSGKILLIDDDKMIRKSLARSLAKIGYEVSTLADGADAVSFLKRASSKEIFYDLVILDATIPGGIGGIEALKRIHCFNKDQKAVLCTGHADTDDVAAWKDHGFKALIPKPCDIKALSYIISDVLKK
ncbi:MAG: PAS domain S-box protein [Verrucomicrobiota bacterium]